MEAMKMDFMDRFKTFIDASANVISGMSNYSNRDFYLDACNIHLKTIGDGKREMRSDMINLGADFKKATKHAKNNMKNGKTAPTEQIIKE